MNVHTLPRAAVNGYLHLLRLPVDAVAGITGKKAEWPPALAFDTFEAKVRTTAGRLLHDEELVDQGELGQVRADQLATAVGLEAEAEAKRSQAGEELEAREEAIRQEAERAEHEAAERSSQAKQAANERKQKVAQDAAKLKQQAASDAADHDRLIADQEQAAEKRRLVDERKALAERQKAVGAKKRAATAAKAAKATKAARS